MTPRADVRRRISGLYGIADAGSGEPVGRDPVGLGADLLAGGCRLVQLRCKGWSPDEVLRAALDLGARCRAAGATFLVNDDPRIAASAGADGVHLGQLDGPVAEARAILGEGAIVGRSTGDSDSLRLAVAEADYVAFGPVFPTPNLSRPKEVRGIDGFARVRGLVPDAVPLVAIGGITLERVPTVRAAGASAWAVIGAVADAADRVAATRALL